MDDVEAKFSTTGFTMGGKASSKKRKGAAAMPLAELRAAAAAASAQEEHVAAPDTVQAASKGATKGKRRADGDAARSEVEPDTELVFEDPYGDDFETDEEAVESLVNADGKPAVVNPMTANGKVVFRPGKDKLADGETLVCDESAYDTFHRCKVEWPSLSFDVVCTNAAGEYNNIDPAPQNTYPLSVTMVMGTQASKPALNKLVCIKMTNLHRTRRKRPRGNAEKDGGDASDSSSEEYSEDDDEGDASAPDDQGIIQNADIKLDTTANRVRVMPHRANIVAIWGESGRVSLVDAAPALDVLHRDSKRRMTSPSTVSPSSVRPFFGFAGHRTEGFALDWSRVVPGRLLSGACNGSIYLWDVASENASSWTVSPDRLRGHKDSVEDIQWSPNERNVFASCSVDKSILFWDAREYRKPALGVAGAHDTDVNVISWNQNETHLIVSGGDDGSIRVWDLRALSQSGDNAGATPAAEFNHHQAPITSVQWHPKDASMLSASSEDGTVTIWDLAVERDAEEELREGVVVSGAEEFPPQLLFIHMGQKNVKEAHWHPACPSLLMSTAEDGLNIFKPSNITLPS